MLFMIKYSIFLSLFTLVQLFLTYLLLNILFITITTSNNYKKSLSSTFDELIYLDHHQNNNHKQHHLTSNSINNNVEIPNHICDNYQSSESNLNKKDSEQNRHKCTNNPLNLVNLFFQDQIKFKYFTAKITTDPSWPLIGLILLNLILILDSFWLPYGGTIHVHLRNHLSRCFDVNLTYVSILIIIHSLPQWIKATIFPRFVIKNLNNLIRILQNSWVLNQPFILECTIMAILITGSILVFFRNKCQSLQSSNDYSEEEQTIHTPHLFRCLSKLFHFLNIVLFSKRRRQHYHHRRRTNNDSVMMYPDDINQNQLDDDLILSEDDQEDQEYEIDEDLETFDLNEDMDLMLIERLFAVPNLWLHTELISNEYMEKLPIWNHQQQSNIVIVDFNQNLITESSCQSSSSSSDEEYMDIKDDVIENQKPRDSSFCFEENNYHLKKIESKSSNSTLKSLATFEQGSSISPSSSPCCSKKKNLIEQMTVPVDDIINISRGKIEKRHRRFIRKKSKNCIDSKKDVKMIQEEQSSNVTTNGNTSGRPSWMIDLHQCTICLDHYELEQLILGLPCGHNYHQSCIGEWLLRGNHCCPICRWPSYRFRHPRQQQQKQ